MPIKYLYLNNNYTFPELCRLKGVNPETAYPKFRKAGHSTDPVDTLNIIAARVRFTWKSIADSIGINPHTFNARVEKHGLETALLMGSKLLRAATSTPKNYTTELNDKSIAWGNKVPEMDNDHETKNLIKSLQALGFEGKSLESEIIKRIS